LYEGFGRPPVEAALSGAPVFASDIPPHGEAARVFPVTMGFLSAQAQQPWTQAFLRAHSGGAV
jgi:hypothetical protein